MTIILLNIGLIYSLLKCKCIDLSLLIDYCTYFEEVIQYCYCQFSPVSVLGRTIRNVMGVEGNFQAAGIFFCYQIPRMNFF